MKVQTHIYTSALLGGSLYATTQSTQIAVSCFLSGIFIDIDHVFDFLIFSGEKFSVKNMFSWCNELRWQKVTLFFHSYEIYIILSIILYYFPDYMFIGILLGSGLHLALDQIGQSCFKKKYKVSPWFYFLVFRLCAGFRKGKMLKII